jgi:hypothetical protein
MILRAFLILAILFSRPLIGQEKRTQANDSTQKKSRKTESEYDLKNYKSDRGDRLIMEVNHTGWLGLPKGVIQEPAKCIGFNISLMFDKPIGNSPISFGYGIGLFSHNFHSNSDFVMHRDSISNTVQTVLEPYARPVQLNRYAQKILEIPIEFRFRTKTDRQFKIHVGGKIGYVVNDFRSIKDADGKIRVYNISNINPIRYGVNFRIGFEQIALSASYYFTEIFKKGEGPSGIIPYSVGIAIIPY